MEQVDPFVPLPPIVKESFAVYGIVDEMQFGRESGFLEGLVQHE
jgi:hypothetical protein